MRSCAARRYGGVGGGTANALCDSAERAMSQARMRSKVAAGAEVRVMLARQCHERNAQRRFLYASSP